MKLNFIFTLLVLISVTLVQSYSPGTFYFVVSRFHLIRSTVRYLTHKMREEYLNISSLSLFHNLSQLPIVLSLRLRASRSLEHRNRSQTPLHINVLTNEQKKTQVLKLRVLMLRRNGTCSLVVRRESVLRTRKSIWAASP